MVEKAWFVVAVLACSCGADKPPMRLYPDSERPASPDEVATLYGDVRDVDGKVVSEHGGRFELLPGCHVVGIVKTWGRMTDTGGVTAQLPRIAFAMSMHGGRRYVVKIDAQMGSSLNGDLIITGHEEDREGNVTNQFQPMSEEGAIQTCRSQSATGSDQAANVAE